MSSGIFFAIALVSFIIYTANEYGGNKYRGLREICSAITSSSLIIFFISYIDVSLFSSFGLIIVTSILLMSIAFLFISHKIMQEHPFI